MVVGLVQSSHWMPFRYLKFYLSCGCSQLPERLHFIQEEKNGEESRQTKIKLYILFCVKEVSISFGRKKTRFLAFRSTGDTMNIFTGDTYLLTLFMSDCPILLSNLISWHHFTGGCTSCWEAWRTSISNRCLENEMPALLPVMPCQ